MQLFCLKGIPLTSEQPIGGSWICLSGMPSETRPRNTVLALQAAYWSGDCVGCKKRKNKCFFSVGFKCLSPLLTAPLKSQVFIIVQEQLSPFSPEKLVTGLNEDLRELVSVFSSNIRLSNLDEAFCLNFLICKMSIMIPASFLWCFELYWLKMLLWPFL